MKNVIILFCFLFSINAYSQCLVYDNFELDTISQSGNDCELEATINWTNTDASDFYIISDDIDYFEQIDPALETITIIYEHKCDDFITLNLFALDTNGDPCLDILITIPDVPVPVELTKWDAVANDNGVLLEWSTEVELFNEGFMLYHSLDGYQREEIAFVAGYGTTVEEKTYSYQHFTNDSENYYQLKQIDTDGGVTWYDVIQVKKPILVKVYPNPVEDILVLETPFEIKKINTSRWNKGLNLFRHEDNVFKIVKL